MILRRVSPALPGAAGGAAAQVAAVAQLDTEMEGARDRLLDWYRPDAAARIRLNLVTTIDGRLAGGDGTSESLTTRLDRMILGVIREHADAVLVGAASVRAEGYRLPRATRLVVLSASGDLRGHRLTARDGAPPVLVLTSEGGADAARRSLANLPSEVVVLPGAAAGRAPIEAVLAAVRDAGAERIVAEGGADLARQLLVEGAVDELCLTTVPRLGGADAPLLGRGALDAGRWTLRQLLLDDEGVGYARWSRLGATSASH